MDLSDYHFREGLRAQKAYDELRWKQQVQIQLERLQRDVLALEKRMLSVERAQSAHPAED